MKMLERLSATQKLLFLGGVYLAGYLIAGWMTYTTINQVAIKSQHYEQIIKTKDLSADVLPPPLFIIESYSTVLQMFESTEPAEQDELVKHYKKLRSEFTERLEFWSANLKDQVVRSELVNHVEKPAGEFYSLVDREVLPLLAKNEHIKARDTLIPKLTRVFNEHRASIDHVVEAAAEQAANLETEVSG